MIDQTRHLRIQRPWWTALRRTARAFGLGKILLHSVIKPLQRLERLRLPDHPCVLDVQGFHLEVLSPRRNRIGEELYRSGIWEPRVTAVIRKTVKPGMTVIDVGADIGYYTVLFAALASPGRVFAFEPIAEARHVLQRNVDRNALDNISISPFALGRETGSAWLREPLEISRVDLSGQEPAPGDIPVEIRRLDDLAQELGLGQVDFLKIDVEGAEHEVLKGFERTLLRDHPACVIEVHGEMLPLFGSGKPEFLEWMSARSYQWRWLDGAAAEETGTSTFLFEA